MALKARIENGQLVGDAPPGYPEGTEFEIAIDAASEDLSAEELESLNSALDRAWASMEAGRFRPATDVMADLRAKMG